MPLSQWFSFRCDTLIDRIKTIIYMCFHVRHLPVCRPWGGEASCVAVAVVAQVGLAARRGALLASCLRGAWVEGLARSSSSSVPDAGGEALLVSAIRGRVEVAAGADGAGAAGSAGLSRPCCVTRFARTHGVARFARSPWPARAPRFAETACVWLVGSTRAPRVAGAACWSSGAACASRVAKSAGACAGRAAAGSAGIHSARVIRPRGRTEAAAVGGVGGAHTCSGSAVTAGVDGRGAGKLAVGSGVPTRAPGGLAALAGGGAPKPLNCVESRG